MKKIKLTALIAALIAGVGIYFFLREIAKPAELPHTDVVVAIRNIPENTRITEDMVELRPVLTAALQAHHLLDIESAVGLVTSGEIFIDEQVVTDRLVQTGDIGEDTGTLAYVVEDGMRAITVSVGIETGLENLLKPGNRVDVIAGYALPPDTEETEYTEETAQTDDTEDGTPVNGLIVQNRTILAVGPVLVKEGTEEYYATVTLLVTPEEALILDYQERYLSKEGGEMPRLILRSATDNEPVIPHELDYDKFLEEVSKP